MQMKMMMLETKMEIKWRLVYGFGGNWRSSGESVRAGQSPQAAAVKLASMAAARITREASVILR